MQTQCYSILKMSLLINKYQDQFLCDLCHRAGQMSVCVGVGVGGGWLHMCRAVCVSLEWDWLHYKPCLGTDNKALCQGRINIKSMHADMK